MVEFDMHLATCIIMFEKPMCENSVKAIEDLQIPLDKFRKIKSKLEQTLAELNDFLAREKRARADIERQAGKPFWISEVRTIIDHEDLGTPVFQQKRVDLSWWWMDEPVTD